MTISCVAAEATPNKILNRMKAQGVQNLTREHVSSYLQVLVTSLAGFYFYIIKLNRHINSFFGDGHVQLTTSCPKYRNTVKNSRAGMTKS